MKKLLIINLYASLYTPTNILESEIQTFIKEKCGGKSKIINEYNAYEMSNQLDGQPENSIIITTTPLLLNLVFDDKHDAESKYRIMLNHKKYDSINIHLKMPRPFIKPYPSEESVNSEIDRVIDIDNRIKKELTSNLDFEFFATKEDRESILAEIAVKIRRTFSQTLETNFVI